jgi:RNA polymerase sigma factor for flagellar operon FliA
MTELTELTDVPAEILIGDLWHAYKATGDLELRNRLVLQYSPLVKYVAGRIRPGLPQTVDVADLLSDGVFGLMDAIEKFEPSRGLQFQTYAVPRIRGAVMDGLRASDWVPRSVRTKLRDIERARASLEEKFGRSPDDREIAAELGISVVELGEIRSKASYAGVAHLEDIGTGEDQMPASLDLDPDDSEMREVLVLAIRGLPERDQIIVTLYYFEGLTLSEIGEVLGVTESRVSQLHTRCALTLRSKLLDLVA